MQAVVAGLILAAGKGTRMQSPLPKVLHPVGGKSMLQRIVETLHKSGIGEINVLLGGEIEAFKEFLGRNPDVRISIQKNRLGTGDAVAAAGVGFAGVTSPSYAAGELVRGPQIKATHVLICAGDTPLLQASTLKEFWQACVKQQVKLGVLGMRHPKPKGYGRMILDAQQQLTAIIEEKDADAKTRQIDICNTGVIFAETKYLFELLATINCQNVQNEYLLTDCIAAATKRGQPAYAYISDDWQSFQGVNDREQLGQVEELLRSRTAN